jgi:hypothetical protein
MRESVGSTWLMGLALTFVLLFSAFLSIAIHYSRVFKIKNEILSILEKYEGYTNGSTGSRKIINDYLKAAGYSATGKCPQVSSGEYKYYAETDLNRYGKNNIYPANGNDAFYCIRRNEQNGYDIILFFKFDLPVIGDLGAINVGGKTKKIAYNKYPIKLEERQT